jgi:hypothetical protein
MDKLTQSFKMCLLAFCIFIIPPKLAFCQGPGQEEKSDKITAAKVAYITSKLNLSTTQAQQFWSVFNEYEAARKKIRKQIRLLKVEAKLLNQSEEELKADLKKLFALRQEELDLEKLYSEKFLKVITVKQLVEYYQSEKEFTKLLLTKIKERRGAGGLMKEDE